MRIPAQCYMASPRAFPRRLPKVEYSACYQVRRVRSNGEIKRQEHRLFLSDALIGEPIGLLATIAAIVQETFSTACYRNDKGGKKNE